MKSILLLAGSILISFAISCIPEANYEPYPSERKVLEPSEEESPLSIEHTYELQVVDINDTPIPEAMVKFYVVSSDKDEEDIVKNSIAYTDSEGKFLKKLLISKPGSAFASGAHYGTLFHYQVTKKGYFPKSGALICDSYYSALPQLNDLERVMNNGAEAAYYSALPQLNDLEPEIKSEKVRLIRPTDYFEPTFLSSKVGIELKDKVLPFIELKIFESLTDCYMQTRSIDIIEFKGKNYLKVGFVSTKVYNSLRLTKYDIAKILFDEVIRKILDPLNSHISDPNRFYGYDLTILAGSKSFARESDMPTPVEYRFIMPQATVRKYKDKDISGQDVLNQSIILMDDERIELKLQ